ncbi:hypothetical protein STEG23_034403 [Scotinomys teguina]
MSPSHFLRPRSSQSPQKKSQEHPDTMEQTSLPLIQGRNGKTSMQNQNLKPPRCPSTEEWIRKMWYIYTTGTMQQKKNDIMKFAGKWMELENVIEQALSLIISWHLFLLGEFASSHSRTFSFDLVHLSIGWNLPSIAFCKAGFVDRLGLFMVSQISWTFCVMTFLDSVFSVTDESVSSIETKYVKLDDLQSSEVSGLSYPKTLELQVLSGAKMGRSQCKSAYNIIKNKTTPESSPQPTPKSDYCNADKAEENDLKKSLMKMLEEAFEEK